MESQKLCYIMPNVNNNTIEFYESISSDTRLTAIDVNHRRIHHSISKLVNYKSFYGSAIALPWSNKPKQLGRIYINEKCNIVTFLKFNGKTYSCALDTFIKCCYALGFEDYDKINYEKMRQFENDVIYYYSCFIIGLLLICLVF
jgi:hypothetical protein